MSKTVSQEYLDGILDGRRVLRTLEACLTRNRP